MFQLLLLASILISSIDAVCKTDGGEKCVPFIYKQNSASWRSFGGHRSLFRGLAWSGKDCAKSTWWPKYSWCATEVTSQKIYNRWDYCDPDTCRTVGEEVAIADTEDCGDCIGCMLEAGCIAMPSDRGDQCLAKGGIVCGFADEFLEDDPELHFEKKGKKQAKEEQEEELAPMRRANKALKSALESLTN